MKAAKPYKCDGCSIAINKGDHYQRTKSLYEGYWSLDRACMACAEEMRVFGEAHNVLLSGEQYVMHLGDCLSFNKEHDDPRWRQLMAQVRRRQRKAGLEISGLRGW